MRFGKDKGVMRVCGSLTTGSWSRGFCRALQDYNGVRARRFKARGFLKAQLCDPSPLPLSPWERGSEVLSRTRDGERPPFSDPLRLPAVDADLRAIDEGGAVAGEEDHDVRELLRLAVAPGWDQAHRSRAHLLQRLVLLRGVGLVELQQALGLDAAGEDGVHGDAVLRHLVGQGLRPAQHCRADAV